jgi:predicted chitinase
MPNEGNAANTVETLAAAIKTAAPQVDARVWASALFAGFGQFNMLSNKRMAAAIGQFMVEAGDGFTTLVENLHYTHADRIAEVFHTAFPNADAAFPFINNPRALANRVYANRLGNHDEASGDGFKFCGRGLIQITGRDNYTAFGSAVGKTAEDAAIYCATPEGAAMSGCWFLSSHGCLPLADAWALSKITRIVNGPAMLGNQDRINHANAVLAALGG